MRFLSIAVAAALSVAVVGSALAQQVPDNKRKRMHQRPAELALSPEWILVSSHGGVGNSVTYWASRRKDGRQGKVVVCIDDLGPLKTIISQGGSAGTVSAAIRGACFEPAF